MVENETVTLDQALPEVVSPVVRTALVEAVPMV
jgi:hypothetical protein